MKVFDQLDVEVIKLLIKDGRRPFVELAKQLMVSPGTVRNRVSKLLNNHAIRRFTVSVDWTQLGLDVEAILLIDTKAHKDVDTVARQLSNLDPVKEAHSTTGQYDILAMVVAKNMEEFRDFMENTLGKMEAINNVYTAIVLKDFKEE